jgi:hypothetical protein
MTDPALIDRANDIIERLFALDESRGQCARSALYWRSFTRTTCRPWRSPKSPPSPTVLRVTGPDAPA